MCARTHTVTAPHSDSILPRALAPAYDAPFGRSAASGRPHASDTKPTGTGGPHMKRSTLLTAAAAGLLSVAIIGAGCEHESSKPASSSSSRSGSTARAGAAEGETMQSTGSASMSAKHGTGTSSAGVTTGNATTGRQTSVSASSDASTSVGTSASLSASDPAKPGTSVTLNAPGDNAGQIGHGPGGIDQRNTETAAHAGGDTVSVNTTAPQRGDARATKTADAKDPDTTTGHGPDSIRLNEQPAEASASASAAAPAADANAGKTAT